MQWIPGKPTAIGWWLVEQSNRDRLAVHVEADEDEDGRPYLRASIDDDSWPLEHPEFDVMYPIARSFGPIPD